MAPKINGFGDLLFLAQEFDSQEKGTKVITFSALDADDAFYFGKLHGFKGTLSMQLLQDALRHVPDKLVYPSIPGPSPGNNGVGGNMSFRQYASDLSDNHYIKRPQLRNYAVFSELGTLSIMKGRLLEEAKAFEVLFRTQARQNVQPHSAIISYYGSIIQRGFITGIVVDYLPASLRAYYEERKGPALNKSAFMRALKSAVQHIHALGLAHNNIHCWSVRVNSAGLPVLSDFAWCHPIGQRLKFSARTPSWREEAQDNEVSEFRNDVAGLKQIGDWIDAENKRLKSEKK